MIINKVTLHTMAVSRYVSVCSATLCDSDLKLHIMHSCLHIAGVKDNATENEKYLAKLNYPLFVPDRKYN